MTSKARSAGASIGPAALERLKATRNAPSGPARPAGKPSVRRFHLGGRLVDLDARVVKTASREFRLTPTECRVLACLAAHENAAVPHEVLAGKVWGRDQRKGAHSLRGFIRSLLRKVEADPSAPRYIVTVPAVGCRLEARRRDDELFP